MKLLGDGIETNYTILWLIGGKFEIYEIRENKICEITNYAKTGLFSSILRTWVIMNIITLLIRKQ